MKVPGRVHVGAVVRGQRNSFNSPALSIWQVAGF